MSDVAAPFDEAPYRSCPARPIHIWVTEPEGFVTYFGEPLHLDDVSARFITETHLRSMVAFPTLKDGRLRFVHCWALITGYDSEARSRMIEWGREVRKNVRSIDIIGPTDAHPLVRMGASVGASSLSVLGIEMRTHFTGDHRTVIRELGLRALSVT